MKVLVENRSSHDLDEERVSILAVSILNSLDFKSGELGVALVGMAEMEELNRQYMGRSGPTDVLSFPIDSEEELLQEGMPRLLGDVIICTDVAEEQAGRMGNTFAEELCLLLSHGILHIAGYDHETDSGDMMGLQEEIFNKYCKGAPDSFSNETL